MDFQLGVAVSIELPDWVWQKPDVRVALRVRNVGAVFRLAQQCGHSQSRIAGAVDMTQSRVNELVNGKRIVRELDVFERVAQGLTMPDDARHLLGLASNSRVRAGGSAFDLAAFPEVVRVYSAQAAAAAEIQRQTRTADEGAFTTPAFVGRLARRRGPGRRRSSRAVG
jgi:transcriptional regulator with XRE-family HTH domain